MKSINKIRCVVVLIAITAVLPLLHGCAAANPLAGQPILAPNGQQATNAAGLPAVQPPLIPNPIVTSTVGTLTTLNNATAPIDPYSGLIKLGLGLTTLIAGGIATWQSNKASGLNTQLASVIQGVETATTDAQGNNLAAVSGAAVKQAIRSQAVTAGVQPALNAKVQSLT